MTEGRINIIDTMPIEAVQSEPGKGVGGQPKRDPEAGWHVNAECRGNMKSTYGYSIHTGVDEDGFIYRQTVTPGNAHDSTERDTLLLGDEVALYADAAYSSRATRKKLESFGIEDQVQRKGYRGHPLSAADVIRNDKIAVTRSGGERPFATYKSRYGLARTRLTELRPCCRTLGYFTPVRERGTKWDNIDAIIQTIIRQLQLSGYMSLVRRKAALPRNLGSLGRS